MYKKMRKLLLCGVAIGAITFGAVDIQHAAAQSIGQGVYLGGQLGLGGGDFDGFYGLGDRSQAQASDVDGEIIGAHLGFNLEQGNIIYGLEADVLFPIDEWEEYNPGANLTPGSNSVTGITNSVDLLASIRGRLGFKPQENVLLFATAGIGYVEANHRVWGSGIGFSDAIADGNVRDITLTDFGPVVGGGIEWAGKDDRWTFRVQGLYYDFGESKDTSGIQLSHNTTGDFARINDAFTVTFGISYKIF